MVPAEARPLLKALGRLDVDIDRVHLELEAKLARRHMTAARRLRRQLAGMNRDLLALERRLEELAANHKPAGGSLAELLAGAPR
jgi:hypothetical protein